MILVKLFLAHILGDFILQPQSWVEDKEKRKWKSGWLYVHVSVHFILILLVLWDLSFWKEALFIAAAHLMIDLLKLSRQVKDTQRFWFFTDQVLHLFVLLLVWLYAEGGIEIQPLPDKLWIIFTGGLFLTSPVSYLIQEFMSRWNYQISTDDKDSLPNAGKYIGILERLFIYTAMLTGHLQVIGFLIAAKSVFRFGDLTRSKDRKLTEYILVGTLISFLLAVFTGMLVIRLME